MSTAPMAMQSPSPTALNPQPRIGEVTPAGSAKPQPSMSQIMSILNTEQSRVQASEKMVAEQVKEITANVTANAESVAASSAAQSVSSAYTTTIQSTNNTSIVNNSLIGVPGASLNTGITSNIMQSYGVPEQHSSADIMSVAALKPPTFVDTLPSTSENKSTEDITLRDLILGSPTIAQIQEQKSGPVVNTKTKDNDAAGSVSIASIATVPLGYEAYSFVIKDVAFYPPTQVYKNQKTVDNARTLRILNSKSDSLHQQMVDEQYKSKQ
jgi:hypothetical protein